MLLRKEKREYLANVNDKDINDEIKFWEKICIGIDINLHFYERQEANTLNNLFSNIIKILKIGKCYVMQMLCKSFRIVYLDTKY